ncbi:hypothetical protein BWQ96_06143 [Gracilariopsis chorda]|uniref:C2H2-type domain-containing protein n=1 Tax=Gracilariopsis chorda TaxID=448386 RepID=A0A2V3IPR1_9FLOR|nr:hypothetical protein BWQ96_06143 [Gracilariopsis chorda]|eukprot:PXF44062.1 hypothetical protein BWQ96_06143 [Gracilariopsis chorda]
MTSASDAPPANDKPIVGSVGLLVEDCEMPDIDWEAYDDPVEPDKPDGNNSDPSSEKPSSHPVVNERSDHVTPDPHPSAEAAPNGDNHPRRDTDFEVSRSLAFLDDIQSDQRPKQVDTPPKPTHPDHLANGNHSNTVPENSPDAELHNPVGRTQDDDNGKTGRYFQSTSWRDRKQNRRKKTAGSVNRLYCDLCGIYCTGQKSMAAHLKGRAHKGKVGQKELDSINKELDRVYEDIDMKSRAEIQQRMEEKRRLDAADSAVPSVEQRNIETPNASRPTQDVPLDPTEDVFGDDDMDIDTIAAPQPSGVPQRSSLEENQPTRTDIQSTAAQGNNEQRASESIQRMHDKEAPVTDAPAQNAPQSSSNVGSHKTALEPEKRPSEGMSSATKKSSGMRERSPPRAQEPERSELPRATERAPKEGENAKEATPTVAPPSLRVDAPPAIRLRSEPISPRLRSEPISPRLRSEPAAAGLRSEQPRSPSLRSEPVPKTNLRSEPLAPTNLRSRPANNVGSVGAGVSQNVTGAAVATNRVKPVAWDPYLSMFNPALVGKEGKRVPDAFLDAVPSMSEWREMRHCVFEKGDDVDKLAFKLMQEILLSPTLGIQASALDHLDRAIKKHGAAHYYSKATGGYSYRKDLADKMWKRERRFIEGDEKWMKEQSDEDKAMHLFCENVHYAFEQGRTLRMCSRRRISRRFRTAEV